MVGVKRIYWQGWSEMGGGMRVARGTMLVYAPRSMDDVKTVLLILQASLHFASSMFASTDA